jgi:hypothetical protein
MSTTRLYTIALSLSENPKRRSRRKTRERERGNEV